MVGWLIALTEGERLGLLGLVGVCITAAASVTADTLDDIKPVAQAILDENPTT